MAELTPTLPYDDEYPELSAAFASAESGGILPAAPFEDAPPTPLSLAEVPALLPAPGQPLTATLPASAAVPLQASLGEPVIPAAETQLPTAVPVAPAGVPTAPVAPVPDAAAPPVPEVPTSPYDAEARRAEELARAQAETARTAATGYTAFAERMGEIQERDLRAREAAQARLGQLREQMQTDRQEIRDLSRAAAEGPSRGTKARFLVGGALQAIKSIIGAGPPNLDLLDQVLGRDAEQKARAITEARRRAGVSGEARDDEMGQLQTLDYFKGLALQDTWEQLEADLRADAAKEKDVAARQQLETAADQARERALQAEATAAQSSFDRQLGYQKQQADIDLKRAQARKVGAEALRAERRATGAGVRRAPSALVERQLQALSPADQKQALDRGVRGIDGRFLTNPDGKIALANKPAEAAKLREQMGNIQDVNAQLNKLLALREGLPLQWSLLNTSQRQAMESAAGTLEAAMNKGLQLGALDEGGLRLVRRITGSENPSGWYDKSATWKELQKDVEGSVNRRLRAQTDFKGKFKLQRYAKPERDMRTVEATIERPYDPISNTAIKAETRVKALDEYRQYLAKERGSLRAATEAMIPLVEQITGPGADKEALDSIRDQIFAAQNAGDWDKADQLRKPMRDLEKFQILAKEWLDKQKKLLGEQVSAEEKEEERLQVAEETGMAAPSGARLAF